jgi:hypothetical protein
VKRTSPPPAAGRHRTAAAAYPAHVSFTLYQTAPKEACEQRLFMLCAGMLHAIGVMGV